MSLKRTVGLAAIIWIVLITVLHVGLNLDAKKWFQKKTAAQQKFRVGFIPVTCHLTCPVTDFINKKTKGENFFEPMRFSGFPELKEMFISHPEQMPATFILAPLAISLREQGIPLKIVYLGHRDGTAMMVHKDSGIFKIADLKGKTIAIPNRYSNQRLLIFKALQEHGMSIKDVTLREMPPPDMPVSLQTRSVDAITSGEPFMGQTEMDGYGRILYLTKDVWPNFISCVLAVHESAITNRRAEVQRLVDGIASSGKWLDQTEGHRLQAGKFVAEQYYNQNPKLLQFVLTKPPDRVKYTNLKPLQKDFEEIEKLGLDSGVLKGTAHFKDYADPSFVPDEAAIKPHQFEAKEQ